MEKNIIRVAVIGMTKNRGGIESVMMNIYRNVDREKVQFDFLIPYNQEDTAYREEIESLGGRILPIIYPQKKSVKKATEGYMNYFKNNPEVKVVHLNTNFPFAFPLKVAKKAGVPVRIIHAHSSMMLFKEKKRIQRFKIAVRNSIIKRQIIKNTNIYFSCSDLAAESTFGTHDYIWVKNGIELERFAYCKRSRETLRKKYGIKNEEKVIGFIARICQRKNPLYALEVFEKYLEINSNAKMIYVGEGELIEQLEEKCKEKGIEKHVVFTGMVSNTNEWYQAFDLFLLPSEFEGLPVVLVEAQTAGLPCLVSDTVTKQVALTDLVQYASIRDEAVVWAKKMDEMLSVKHDRAVYKEQLEKAGFAEQNVAKQVEKYYLSVGEYR